MSPPPQVVSWRPRLCYRRAFAEYIQTEKPTQLIGRHRTAFRSPSSGESGTALNVLEFASSHAFPRSGHRGALLDRNHALWRAIPARPENSEGLLPGRPNRPVV